METRGNYVLIGAVALFGFIGMLAFFLWFAKVEVDRQYAYYDVHFPSVSGLSRASDVRFSGLPVGQVVDVRLSPDRDGTVLVRLEVSRETPVRVDSIATIESQGVTGVSYVGISAGEPTADFLLTQDGSVPVITSGRSVLQTLSEDAPEIITQVLDVTKQVRVMLNEENLGKLQTILDNLENSSNKLGSALDDFAVVAEKVGSASADIADFTGQLQPTVDNVNTTLATMNGALDSIKQVADRAQITLGEGDKALASGKSALDAADAFMQADLPAIVKELTDTTTALRAQIDAIGTTAQATLGTFDETGTAATARLTELQGTLAATDAMIADLVKTIDGVYTAAGNFDTLMTGDGTALMAETRAMIADANAAVKSIGDVAQTDLPGIVADIKAATETATTAVADISAKLTSASGRIDGVADDAQKALAQVTDTFSNANTTLSAINSALETGQRTLTAAEQTFTGANKVIDEDIGPLVADLRGTITKLDAAVAQVSQDIPGITADLRAAADSAAKSFAEVQRVVTESGKPIGDFAANGLPQYARLAAETRGLIANLDRLTKQIQRDPARFFLSSKAPEFRK